jgi:hypothetical protein
MQEMLYQIMFIFGASVCKVYVDTVDSQETIHRLWSLGTLRPFYRMYCSPGEVQCESDDGHQDGCPTFPSFITSPIFVAASLLVFVIVQAAFLLEIGPIGAINYSVGGTLGTAAMHKA